MPTQDEKVRNSTAHLRISGVSAALLLAVTGCELLLPPLPGPSTFLPRPPTKVSDLRPQPGVPEEKSIFGLTGLQLYQGKLKVKEVFSKLGVELLQDKGRCLSYANPPKNPLGFRCKSLDLYFENDLLMTLAIQVYNDLKDHPFDVDSRSKALAYYWADSSLRISSLLGDPLPENQTRTEAKAGAFTIQQQTVYWALDPSPNPSDPNLKEVVGLTTSGDPALGFAVIVRFEVRELKRIQ